MAAYTVVEVAKRYNVPPCNIYRRIQEKKMPCLRLGRDIRITDEHLAIFEAGNTQGPVA